MPYTDLTPGYERVKELNDGIAAMNIDIRKKEPVCISASFGMALLDPEITVEATIDRAEKALYAAKAAGRNCVRIWNPSM